MKTLFCLCLLLCSSSLLAATGLDFSKLQYPVEDAEQSFKAGKPEFVAVLHKGKLRFPGLSPDQRKRLKEEGRTRTLNEYVLYQSPEQQAVSDADIDTRIALEKYASRYNRQLLNLLGW